MTPVTPTMFTSLVRISATKLRASGGGRTLSPNRTLSRFPLHFGPVPLAGPFHLAAYLGRSRSLVLCYVCQSVEPDPRGSSRGESLVTSEYACRRPDIDETTMEERTMGSIRIESKWLKLKPVFLILWSVCVTYIYTQGSG